MPRSRHRSRDFFPRTAKTKIPSKSQDEHPSELRMRSQFNVISVAKKTSWVRHHCSTRHLNSFAPRRAAVHAQAATRPSRSRKGTRRSVLLAASVGTLGAATLTFGEDVQHGYAAAVRAGRVGATLAVCINEYVAEFLFNVSITDGNKTLMFFFFLLGIATALR